MEHDEIRTCEVKQPKELRDRIIEILEDCEYYQPKMIIEEKEPFFWRINKSWLKDKAGQISKLLEAEKEE